MSAYNQNAPNRNSPIPGYSVFYRYFFVGMALFLMLFVVLGFGSTYGLQLLYGKEISGMGVVETDWAIHLHAAVFVGWMLLLITQTFLVARGQTANHMAIGKKVGIGMAFAIVTAGIIIVITMDFSLVRKGLLAWSEWTSILLVNAGSILGLVIFSILFFLGFRKRKQPAPHKRYMLFATITLVIAATSRMHYLLGPAPWANHIGTFLMVVPIIGYDLYNMRRIHKATFIGTGLCWGAVVVSDILESFSSIF